MGKWRQGLKIDLGATKQRTALFNLVQEFYPARPSSSRKNSLSLHFFTILLYSRWTYVHFMGKWGQGLKIDLGATKQRTVLFNLAQEFYPAQPSSSRKNSLSLHVFTILLHSRCTNVHFMGKWRQGLKIDLGATKQLTALFNLVQEFYPARPSSSRKNALSLHFFTILLDSRWTYVHFMGKWGQGLKIELVATKQRTVLFNLAQEFYPDHPSPSRKNSLSKHVFTILLHSILFANGDRGWKSTSGQQSSGQHFLTLYNNFTQLGHPLQEKNRLVCIFSQFCFIPGEHMSILWANGDRGLKSTSGQQSSGQYFLTSHKNFIQLIHPLQEKIR